MGLGRDNLLSRKTEEDQDMRIVGIFALLLLLAACTGDRLRQSAIEQPQVVVAI